MVRQCCATDGDGLVSEDRFLECQFLQAFLDSRIRRLLFEIDVEALADGIDGCREAMQLHRCVVIELRTWTALAVVECLPEAVVRLRLLPLGFRNAGTVFALARGFDLLADDQVVRVAHFKRCGQWQSITA
ncbi:hypothetical protein D3C81_1924150 [compost metagenome]